MNILRIFIIKELLQFKRDPKMFMVVIIAPVIQLIFLGYAANRDIKNIHSVILDRDKSVMSRNFISSFEKSGYFTVDYVVESYDKMEKLINEGKVLLGIPYLMILKKI